MRTNTQEDVDMKSMIKQSAVENNNHMLYGELLENLLMILPHESELISFRDEDDTFELKESSLEEHTNIILKIDYDTIFVRYISINVKHRRQGHFTKLIKYLLDFCVKHELEIFFESCNEVVLKIVRKQVETYSQYKLEESFLGNDPRPQTDMNITFSES